VCLAACSIANFSQQANPSSNTGNAKVVSVVDGDTIAVDIEGRQNMVRYSGIDTPETVHPFKPLQYFVKEGQRK